VFTWCYTGVVLQFIYGPIVIWFGRTLNLYVLLGASIFQLMGGIVVAMSVLYAMAADVSEEKDKYDTQSPDFNPHLLTFLQSREFSLSRTRSE
jgi:hypothetical protein